MAIHVICPGCHARFKVSDKFAGKTGACPKCKGSIEVPSASEQVVIHEREFEAGAKDAQGRNVLKPVARTDTAFNPLMTAGAVCMVVIALVVAFAMRAADGPEPWLLALGAVFVAPPLTWAGYFFLRDDELEGYQGSALAIRTAICSLAYALLWGVYGFLYPQLFGDTPFEIWNIFPLLPLIAVGAGAAYVCYDLDLGSGFFHYSLYLAATVVLRMAMGLPALGPPEKTAVEVVVSLASSAFAMFT